jgi:phosphonoacetaldehyde hydrolase
MEAVVKVGDTVADIGEGLNAGMWTIGVVEHGNEVGLSAVELGALSPERRAVVNSRARQRLVNACAHYVVETIADVPSIVSAINERLALGERP